VTTSGGNLEVALSAMVASGSPNATIVAVTYAVDGASPVPMTEVDGAFDAVAEAATAIITGLTGSHSICITATDSTGAVSEPQLPCRPCRPSRPPSWASPIRLGYLLHPLRRQRPSLAPSPGPASPPLQPQRSAPPPSPSPEDLRSSRSRWSQPVSRPAHAVS
jgi:hypothetical protein